MAIVRPPIEPHDVHSKRLMQHAFEQLEQGDRLQAGEKAWGAVAHALKVIAIERGMDYSKHKDARFVMEEAAKDSPDRDAIRGAFAIANDLHRNYYEDVQQREQLALDLRQIRGLLTMLEDEQARWRRTRAAR